MKILENDKNLSDNEDSQDSNEEDTEKEEVPLTKKKSVRTEKQMEAFKKAQQTRQANIKKIQHEKELNKLNKKEEKILNKKKDLIKDIVIPETKPEKIKKSKVVLASHVVPGYARSAPEPIVESSSEEEIVVIKKKKKPKKKTIIIEESSDSESEESSPEPIKERKMKSQLNKKSIIKMDETKINKKDSSFDTNKWFI